MELKITDEIIEEIVSIESSSPKKQLFEIRKIIKKHNPDITDEGLFSLILSNEVLFYFIDNEVYEFLINKADKILKMQDKFEALRNKLDELTASIKE